MSNLKELKPVNKVQNIINRFCYTIGMIPTSYKLSMTYEEQVMAIGKYLEDTVIPALNNNAEAVQELQDAFITLKNYVDNYFDNLDVQTEINNKLDEMIKDGTISQLLENIIDNNIIHTFNTISDLKNSNLKINTKVQTLGYHTIADNGGAYYIISDTLPTQGYYEILNNNLYAILLINDNINIKQFGAYGDSINDDTTIIQTAINFIRLYNLNNENPQNLIALTFPSGTYKITNTIILSPLVHIKTNGTVTFHNYSDNTCFHLLPQVNDNPQWYHYNGKYIATNDGIHIINMNNSSSSTIGLEISTDTPIGDFKRINACNY